MTAAGRRANGEGSTPRQRPDGRWVVEFRHVDDFGKLQRSYVYGSTQKEVVAKAKEVRKRLENDMPATDAKITLGAFAQTWLDSTLAASDRKPTTKATLTTLIKTHLIGTKIGVLPLDKIRATSVEAWLVELRTAETQRRTADGKARVGLSEASVQKLYAVLKMVLDGAVRDGLIARNPAAAVARPKATRKEAGFLDEEGIRRLLAAAQGTRHATLFEVMLHTGLRPGEALALRWDDVDLDERLLRIDGTLARVGGQLVESTPKTIKSRRWLHITDRLEAVLVACRKRQLEERLRAGSEWRQTGYIFTSETGLPLDPRNALRAIKAAAAKAGLSDTIGLHSLRHSAASAMLTNGVPLTTVSEVLGHGSAVITASVYSHVSPRSAAAALDALGAALAVGGGQR